MIKRLLFLFLFINLSITFSIDASPITNTDISTDNFSSTAQFFKTKIKGANASFIPDKQDSLSFNPTPGDVSVVFLGNIFGVVDGVLAGSGSQIIGSMLGVFNAAVLAFGGIILLYSLIISTSSTAHEGQMLGQKWSSIWLPLRSFIGVGAILPLTSGYCLIQIFVMWLVVQGIGAADSVWSAALNYLNRGGVIVQKQMSTTGSRTADGGAIMDGAMGILAAQACMNTLEVKYKLLHKSEASGNKCSNTISKSIDYSVAGNVTSNDGKLDSWYQFCSTPVPSFTGSVNITSDKNTQKMLNGENIVQAMPDFSSDVYSPYYTLSGICGQLSWDPYSQKNEDNTLSQNELLNVQNSRSIAVMQMYEALLPVAAAMTDNAVKFNTSFDCTTTACASNYVRYNFGEPLLSTFKTGCKGGSAYNDSNACINWGNAQQQMAIFNGRELQDAVAAYNGIMLPTLNLDSLNDSGSRSGAIYDPATASYYHRDTGPKKNYKKQRAFINQAKSQGWLMAGAYFFRLALLNNFMTQNKNSSANMTDSSSNLKIKDFSNNGNWTYSVIDNRLNKKVGDSVGTCEVAEPFCYLESQDFVDIGVLIAGSQYTGVALPTYASFTPLSSESWYAPGDNNVFAYLVNANSITLKGQTTALNAGMNEDAASGFNPSFTTPTQGKINIGGGKWNLPGKGIEILWNTAILPVINLFNFIMISLTQQLLSLVISPMVSMVGTIFYKALNVMRMEGVNPIVSIAIMGTQFIDGVGNAWIAILLYASFNAMTIIGLIVMIPLMPLVTIWMGIMLGVGFTAAFYVPFVPFLIFSFAGLGWMISVIESIVAAPIVGLGIIMPDGHDAFGKSEEAILLMLNVFLRPSMMIMGYIFGIILSYVGVWVLNAGFNYALYDFMLLPPMTSGNFGQNIVSRKSQAHYGFWSSIFVLYFSILTYVASYMAIVEHAFELIYYLPDKVLRWISGGVQEQFGEGIVPSMLHEVKQQSNSASKSAVGAMSKVASTLSAGLEKFTESEDDDDDSDNKKEEESEAKEGEQESGKENIEQTAENSNAGGEMAIELETSSTALEGAGASGAEAATEALAATEGVAAEAAAEAATVAAEAAAAG